MGISVSVSQKWGNNSSVQALSALTLHPHPLNIPCNHFGLNVDFWCNLSSCFLTQQMFVTDFTVNQFKVKLLTNSCEVRNNDKDIK